MRLNQVTIPVTDVARSVEFYVGLGLTQIVDGGRDYAGENRLRRVFLDFLVPVRIELAGQFEKIGALGPR